MNPMVWNTVGGDLTTGWRHSAAVTIVRAGKGATDLRMLTKPRLLPTRCRLFRQVRVPAAHGPVAAHDHGEVGLKAASEHHSRDFHFTIFIL